MGNCWSRQSHSPAPNSSTAVGKVQTGSNQSRRGFLQSAERGNVSSTSQRFSSLSLGDARLLGPSSSNTFTTSSASTSYGGSGISQNGRTPVRVQENFPNGQILADPNLRPFTLAELKAATKDFRSDNFLGQGGFGTVHKGCVKVKPQCGKIAEQVVAVKRLNSESMQGFREWQSEIDFLGRLSHPNLVRLLGYGREDGELFLVYEYMHRGSLENQLYGRGSNVRPLSWDMRLKVMIGSARGLNFLHSLERQIIYRDFKPSNVLLDKSYTAKLSDFGLAKLGPPSDHTHVSTRVVGTHGYAAPEYIATGHLYVKSDVYGFGIVVLELLTGKRIADIMRLCQRHNLIQWIKSNLLNRMKLKSTMDPRLEGKYPLRLAIQIAQLAVKCIQLDHKYRPSMAEVTETFEGIEAANSNPNNKKGASASSSQQAQVDNK